MSMERVHSLGDSWTCIEAGGANAGWQVYAEIKPQHRHGIPGSTAAQWAADEGRILTRAMATMQPDDVVVVSLIGNDIRHASDDGQITFGELVAGARALYAVVERLIQVKVRTALLIYSDPYFGHKPEASAGIMLMETIIRGVAAMHKVDVFDTQAFMVDPLHFDGVDFHPTKCGHVAIAAALRKEVEG